MKALQQNKNKITDVSGMNPKIIDRISFVCLYVQFCFKVVPEP